MSGHAPTDLHALFRARPWAAIDAAATGPAAAVPTMLSEEERKLYFWLAREVAQGVGAIVDLGCFAGGSTARLAEGRRQAGHGGLVHAWDRFTAQEEAKAAHLYAAGVARVEGHDILPLARELLAPWGAMVRLCPGEIEDGLWDGGPIEILTVDAAKSAGAADAIAAQFFPALIPGRSIVVQQDYFHWRQPWLPVQMERLAHCFEPLAICPDSTAVFLCTRTPDAEALAQGACEGLEDSDLVRGIAAARQRMARFGQDDRFDAMEAALAANPGERIAWRFRRP